MRSARYELDLKKRIAALLLQNAVFRNDLLKPLRGTIEDLYHIGTCVLHEICRHRIPLPRQDTVYRRKVELADLIVADLFVHFSKCCRVFCGDHNATRIAVDAITERGGKGLLCLGIVFSLSPQICLDV